jgi:hypothetical protein
MGYGELIRSEEVAGSVFRLMRTEHGYAISCTSERFEGLLPPVRWLFRTDEAAQVGFDFLVVTSRWTRAIERQEPRGELKAEAERLMRLSQETHKRLDDYPVLPESSWEDDQIRIGQWGMCLNCDHEITSHDPGGQCRGPDDCDCHAFMWSDLARCVCGHLPGAHAGPVWEPVTSRRCLSPGCDCGGFG